MPRPNDIRNISDLIAFLNYLKKRGIHYSLGHHREDSVLVALTVVGARVEVDFLADDVQFSVFTGNEDVETGVAALCDVIDRHWDAE